MSETRETPPGIEKKSIFSIGYWLEWAKNKLKGTQASDETTTELPPVSPGKSGVGRYEYKAARDDDAIQGTREMQTYVRRRTDHKNPDGDPNGE